jgi:undecaprenyl-diphosphatase
MLDALLAFDKSLFLLINHGCANGALDAFFVVITNGKSWILPGILAALIFLKVEKKRGRLGRALAVLLLAAATVALSDPVCARIIKPLFHRIRPCNPLDLVEGGRFLLGYKNSFSFPSSHAMNMFGQAMLFSFFYPRLSPWFFLFASVIGFSRIYVGVHWPLDVLGGAAFGTLCGALVYGAYRLALLFRRKNKPC